ncbi:hypothetical protein [Candidatus Pelagibacter sp. HIMB1321]|uniref:hypothetical protein n=1 Tax=Candidatus Pelagibacter sp. HIMB1321 TaxID=1388755 RepID=UPI000A07E3DB|nr:hypothetical protein [Candidatus Pelagibacter sp. HIMB1321]SMF74372.1 hypothetical protein SAMN02744631_0433 [Candidatus Pelagibacter sp. HIMB1321]
MKKIVSIVVLSLLLSGNVLANCRDNVEMNWTIKDNSYVRFTFLNNSDNKINVYEYGILTSDNKLIKKNKKSDTETIGGMPVLNGAILGNFGREVLDMNVVNINTNVIKYAYYQCKFID